MHPQYTFTYISTLLYSFSCFRLGMSVKLICIQSKWESLMRSSFFHCKYLPSFQVKPTTILLLQVRLFFVGFISRHYQHRIRTGHPTGRIVEDTSKRKYYLQTLCFSQEGEHIPPLRLRVIPVRRIHFFDVFQHYSSSS